VTGPERLAAALPGHRVESLRYRGAHYALVHSRAVCGLVVVYRASTLTVAAVPRPWAVSPYSGWLPALPPVTDGRLAAWLARSRGLLTVAEWATEEVSP
jgi:hypothetical protein